jgi:hypothetical protein
MAGLIIWHKKEMLELNNLKNNFQSIGYLTPKYLRMGNYSVLVFPKKKLSIDNWKEFPAGTICAVGTFGYKGFFYQKALPYIFNDIKNNQLDIYNIWGTFIIVIHLNSDLYIIRDGAITNKLYTHINKTILSTSFAGLIESLNTKYTFDSIAATELITTGVLTGNSTILKEIKELNTSGNYKDIKIIHTQCKPYPTPTSRRSAFEQQVQINSDYFNRVIKDWKNYSKNGIIDIGLTGGMDSRLLAISVLKQTKNVAFHTHWRKDQFNNSDFKYAFLFARKAGLEINSPEVKPPLEMSAYELQSNFHKSYNFSDGIIRPGVYWDEEYSTEDYRSYLNKSNYLRFLGYGGEQYRNGERLPLNSKRSLSSWINWEMFYQFAGRNFIDNHHARLIEKRIKENILESFNTTDLHLNLYNYKRYIQLVQSPSYRSIQSTIENKIGFCLSPFLDINLSIPSLLAVPFLGKSIEFQLNMMTKMSYNLAAIPNGYGFDFTKGEPAITKKGSIIWQKLPPWIKYPLYAGYKRHYYSDYIEKLENRNNFIKDILYAFDDLKLPIITYNQKKVRSRSKLILNMGYFVLHNRSKLIIPKFDEETIQ